MSIEDVFTGETPLLHATRQGHFDTAKYLLDHGADPAASSELGATPVHHAAGIGLPSFAVKNSTGFTIKKKL